MRARNRRNRLADGEVVVVDVRPHWWFLAGPVFVLAAVIAGAVAALVEGVPAWVHWITVAALAAAAVWLLGRYARWASTRLVVTTVRIMERRGLLGRVGREIPIVALTDIGYRQTLFQRIIGAGDVLVESAGRDSQEVFADLPRPAAIHNEIYEQLDRIRSYHATGAPPASIPEQIDQLDRLRQRGVITEAEFAAKKADLLDRL